MQLACTVGASHFTSFDIHSDWTSNTDVILGILGMAMIAVESVEMNIGIGETRDSYTMGKFLHLGLGKRTILVQGFVRSKDHDR